jgi:hypothetical protein
MCRKPLDGNRILVEFRIIVWVHEGSVGGVKQREKFAGFTKEGAVFLI